MSCPRSNSHQLLVYGLFMLIIVQQTVNSLQNGYRQHAAVTHHRWQQIQHTPGHIAKDTTYTNDPRRRQLTLNGVDGDRQEHHYRHQHHRQIHRQQPTSTASPMRSRESHRFHISSPMPNSFHRPPNRRIEEAVHAFQASTTPRLPSSHRQVVHHRSNQPLYSHQAHHHSLRSSTHHSAPMHHQQTLRPRPDDSLEVNRKSLPWAANHHRGSIVVNDFSTAAPSIARTVPLPRPESIYSEGRSTQHQLHAKHLDAETEDDEDDNYDEDYYDYEGDNGNVDDNENGNNNERANANANRYRAADGRHGLYDLGYSESTKSASEGLLTNDEVASYVLHGNSMDYSFLADAPDDGLGSLTEQKWRNYSTREGVEQMARAENPSIAAAAHLKRMKQEAMCKYPHPKVIPISSNNTSKRFVPRCTILHRCGDDTGCCSSDIQTCVAKTTVPVVLYFYVFSMGKTHPVIEPLSLINHTECHCVDKRRLHTATTPPSFVTTTSPERQNNGCVTYFDLDDSDPEYLRCDCIVTRSERRQACQSLARGEEGFMLEDQRCISQGRCKLPTCEYGQYNKTMGRCPDKYHKITIAKSYPN